MREVELELGRAEAHSRQDQNAARHASMVEEPGPENGKVWYWGKTSGGRELATREVIDSDCWPNADISWSAGDLLNELDYPTSKAGSDLLDGKVLRLLGIRSHPLKPTQRLEDAKHLLSLRYQGLPSKHEWRAEIEHLPSGYMAFISVRVQATSPDAKPGPWHLCLTTDGASAALAVTIAAITRETWTFPTQT